eukprot:TRINITY_DN4307_c0_g1_i1.p1 TRINITY_DN4307_c0_g1~~TRINITY_DN4307_c0_g1_i1.p1  ORF type:complete len:246 (-),score=40.98 TRINITY_DN4307_c0_g1_i1:133-870(-)
MGRSLAKVVVLLTVLCSVVCGVYYHPTWINYKLDYSSHYWSTSSSSESYGTGYFLLTQNGNSQYHQLRLDIRASANGPVVSRFYQFETRNFSNNNHIRELSLYTVNPNTGACSISHSSNVPGYSATSKCTPSTYVNTTSVKTHSGMQNSFSFSTTCAKVTKEVWTEVEWFSTITSFPVRTDISVNLPPGQITEYYWDFVPGGASSSSSIYDLPSSCYTSAKKREVGNLEESLDNVHIWAKLNFQM